LRRSQLAGALLALAAAALAAGCGGGGGESSSLALGEQASVQHTNSGAAEGTPTTILGVTVLAVRPGTQQELEDGGFSLDPDEKELKPYYVDVRYENQGDNAIKRSLGVGLRDQDDDLISEAVIISLGGPPFAECPRIREGTLEPGDSYESCSLFLLPQGSDPDRVHFLPYVPGIESDWVFWDASAPEDDE
jgi:hypothetical protein